MKMIVVTWALKKRWIFYCGKGQEELVPEESCSITSCFAALTKLGHHISFFLKMRRQLCFIISREYMTPSKDGKLLTSTKFVGSVAGGNKPIRSGAGVWPVHLT
jgi:hypothetical protein